MVWISPSVTCPIGPILENFMIEIEVADDGLHVQEFIPFLARSIVTFFHLDAPTLGICPLLDQLACQSLKSFAID
jgi:hypothetical protein